MDEDLLGRGEMRGKYAEDELVEDLLGKGEEFDYLRFQMAQNAVSDQRLWANAAAAWANVMLGKVANTFPKAVVENVVTENVSKTVNDDTQATTSKETLDNMVDRFSKVTDAVANLESQLTDVITTLARIEIEGK